MKKALIKIGLLQLLVSFLVFALIAGGASSILFSAVWLLMGGGLLTVLLLRKAADEDALYTGFLTLGYTSVIWAASMLISGGFTGHAGWLFYSFLHLPLMPVFFLTHLTGESRLFLWAPLAFELAFLAAAIVRILVKHKLQAIPRKKFLPLLAIILVSFSAGTAVQLHRSTTVLPSYGFEYGGGYSSTDLTPYELSNPDNKLPKLKEAPSFQISQSEPMPVLDGAEAAYPVYSAFANAVYEDSPNRASAVGFTNTIYSYEMLINRHVDIFFGAEPSAEQRKMAEKAGVELVMTPIAKEAFVFFVNPENKVDSLKVSEIQSIYSGKIKNWAELGGTSDKIVAFQRPADSGSQTMLEKIMRGKSIMQPLKEEVPAGMGGIIEQVADYRNFDNSIGFSFRFFATGMNANPDIKLLAIDGIEPTPENIASRKYPFTANLYAITLKDNPKKTVKPFLQWMQGPQGQQIAEEIGYIRN